MQNTVVIVIALVIALGLVQLFVYASWFSSESIWFDNERIFQAKEIYTTNSLGSRIEDRLNDRFGELRPGLQQPQSFQQQLQGQQFANPTIAPPISPSFSTINPTAIPQQPIVSIPPSLPTPPPHSPPPPTTVNTPPRAPSTTDPVPTLTTPSSSFPPSSSPSSSSPLSSRAPGDNGVDLYSLPDVSDPEFAWFWKILEQSRGHELIHKQIKRKEHQWRKIAFRNIGRGQKVLMYLGWIAFWHMDKGVQEGGPSGEFVFWSDLFAGFSAIGYEVVLAHTKQQFWSSISGKSAQEFSFIVTDYDGLGTAENVGDFPKNHCKYFIMDFFGTWPGKFNIRNLDLRRVWTPYDFDDYNTAINFVAEALPRNQWKTKQSEGLLWGKNGHYMKTARDAVEVALAQGVLHDTIARLERIKSNERAFYNQLQHHGYMSKQNFLELLSAVSYLLGVNDPIDGPTALEAMAHGTAFINPIKNPPVVYPDKPTERPYTSQHPWIERNVGPPYAYTLDIHDRIKLESTLQSILHDTLDTARQEFRQEGFIPFAYTVHGYIENLIKVLEESVQQCDPQRDVRKHPNNPIMSRCC